MDCPAQLWTVTTAFSKVKAVMFEPPHSSPPVGDRSLFERAVEALTQALATDGPERNTLISQALRLYQLSIGECEPDSRPH